MSIRKFNVNKTESQIALASTMFPGFMSPEDKLALDTLVAANFAGGSITSVTVEMKDVTEIKNRLTSLETDVASIQSTVSALKSKLDLYPAMHNSDNATYGIKNGAWEIVCGAGEVVLTDDEVTAASLALQSLEEGVLLINEETEPEIVEELKELLGEELFNELATKSASTLELHPEPSFEEKLETAKKDYLERKMQNDLYQQYEDMSQYIEDSNELSVIKEKGEVE